MSFGQRNCQDYPALACDLKSAASEAKLRGKSEATVATLSSGIKKVAFGRVGNG
jgi:hypothetical protein